MVESPGGTDLVGITVRKACSLVKLISVEYLPFDWPTFCVLLVSNLQLCLASWHAFRTVAVCGLRSAFEHGHMTTTSTMSCYRNI